MACSVFGKVELHDALPDFRDGTVIQELACGLGIVLQCIESEPGHAAVALVDQEALARQPDCRLQRLLERQTPVESRDVHQRGRFARNAGSQRAI